MNRIKTETTPNGDTTHWEYQGSCMYCILPSNELIGKRYEAGQVAEAMTWNAQRNITSHSTYSYDPVTDYKILNDR